MGQHSKAAMCASLAALLLGAGGLSPAQAEDFYKGKRIKFLVGSSAGGGYDTFARVLARHYGKHIAGNPSFIVQNMPGASSRKVANFIYAQAPKDGTTIAAVFSGIPTEPLVNPDKAHFDARKFTWIGSANKGTFVGFVWATAPVTTLDGLKTKQMIVGASGGATYDFPALANELLGLNFKIISGYTGTKQIGLAMERGEVHGNAGTTWASIKTQHPGWLKEKKVKVFVQYARDKHPELPDVPQMMDLAKNDNDRQALNLMYVRQEYQRPYIAPPGLPADRVKILRAAFNATMKDPAYLDDAKKRRLEISPLSGERIEALIAEVYKTPKDVVDRVRAILNKRPKAPKKASKKKKN
ncbi:MAG: tripartite tricarboxylate transporter substrate-binding protein [Alphaproteobacteria bacterium]|nr:tripartite tricarboxylate transporter substrate-binding protein [Alphaproteobacteria bacterium]